ncbi:MAG TPA: DUF3616 domain-containing protein [Leptolyngbyaceae cyanobacterium M65_K2018_010]|nr:DUF3616 domain-containing protein [Leptolyngbyaceae cyanobacterium M65_K2018_010]
MNPMKLTVTQVLQHYGMCDASAAIALDPQHFVVANDEDNILRIYSLMASGGPVAWGTHGRAGLDVNGYFDNNPKHREVDIEAAAQIGSISYWITSHGRTKDGKPRPERHQFFAQTISQTGERQSLRQVGGSYTQLVADMRQDQRLQGYCFDQAEKLPPKQPGGLNIEGLTATPSQELYLGFRNPIPQGKALLLPLKNPQDLVQNNHARAQFGEPIELDLNGLGIRSIDYWASQKCYLIIAGIYHGGDEFALYRWSGLEDKPQPMEITGLPPDFRPEGVFFHPHQDHQFHLLSDDGSIVRGAGVPCKDIPDSHHPHKYFRSLVVELAREPEQPPGPLAPDP